MAANVTSAASRVGAVGGALLLVGVAAVFALFAAEAALRIFHLAPVGGVATVTSKEFAKVPGMFSPHQRVLDTQNPALPYRVTIDSLGFRGPEVSRAKPPGQLRVLMIGDSFVYGDFVDDNQTFPAQLEERLRTACRDPLVINAGVGGTTIVDEAFMLQRALSLEPDLVILVYVENDFEDLAARTTAWEQLAQNRSAKSRFPLSILYPVVRHMALWNLGLRVRATSQKQQEKAVLQPASAVDTTVILRLRERYGEALTAFRDTLAARRIPFVFAMYPSWLELQSAWEKLTWTERYAETHGIHGVNLLPALQATQLPATKLYLIPKDGHPSPLGYSMAADTLAGELLHGTLVRSLCKP